MPRSRQQRRARSRRPSSPRRRGSAAFLVFILLLSAGGAALVWFSRANPPPLTRGAIAGEHWHASYRIYICGKRMTNYPTLEGEIHSHGDGFMHIHPSTPGFTGEAANLGAFFRQYETVIGQDENGKRFITFPDGTRYEDGKRCPDKKAYNLEVLNNGDKIEGDPASFIMHDDDEVVIRFGEEGDDPLPNAYAKAKGIPDPGFGPETPRPDTAEPPPEQPQRPPGSPEPSPSPSG